MKRYIFIILLFTGVTGFSQYQPDTTLKQGGVMFRQDNWLWSSGDNVVAACDGQMLGYQAQLLILDKYGIRETLALNEMDSLRWSATDGIDDKWFGNFTRYKRFWKSVQDRGHEIADHGSIHTNYSFIIEAAKAHRYPKGNGVLNHQGRTGSFAMDSLIVSDTVHIPGALPTLFFTTTKGLNVQFQRAKEMFAIIGLKTPTYWVEGGSQSVDYNDDSVQVSSDLMGFIGAGKYKAYSVKYKSQGYDPPQGWRSEFFMDWEAVPESITCYHTPWQSMVGTVREMSAAAAIKRIVDNSAHNALTIIASHPGTPDQGYVDFTDSICAFLQANRYKIPCMTGSQWARRMYILPHDNHQNSFPHNILSGSCFEDNLDAAYGDTIPDGWTMLAGCYKINNGYHGKAVVVNATESSLQCNRLYGIEKGANTLSFAAKEISSTDSIIVKIYFYGGTAFTAVWGGHSGYASTLRLAWLPTTSWTIKSATVTVPTNTSFIEVAVWARAGTIAVDEFKLIKQ
jgi:hypothetical protein